MRSRTPLVSSIALSALLFALGTNAAVADSVSVNVTGHVTSVFDSNGLLGGQITPSQAVSASYTYDLTVPDALPGFQQIGWYPMSASQAAVQVSVGSLTTQNSLTSQLEVSVHSTPPSGGSCYFEVWSGDNLPLVPELSSSTILFSMGDPTGQGLPTDALPTFAPDAQQFPNRTITLYGSTPDGRYYYVNIEIDSMSLPPPPEEVS